MLSILRLIILKFLKYGTTNELTYIQSQKIITFNLFVLIGIPLQISFALYFLFHGDIQVSLGNFLQLGIFILGYLSINWPNGLLIRKMVVFISSILTIYCSIVNNNGNEIMLLPLIICALITYDSIVFFIIHTLLSLFAIIYIHIAILHSDTMINLLSIQHVNFSASMLYLISVLAILKFIFITRQNLLDKKIESVQKQNKALKEIAWIQSHVVRAPMARMMAAASLINLTDGNKIDTKTILTIVQNSANELDTIIKDITAKANENNLEEDFII